MKHPVHLRDNRMNPFYSCFTALHPPSQPQIQSVILEDKIRNDTVESSTYCTKIFMILFPLNHESQIGERQILALTHRPIRHSHRLHFSDISYSLKFCKFLVVHWIEWLPDGVEFPPVVHIFNLPNYDLRSAQQYPFCMELIISVWQFSERFLAQESETGILCW